MDKQREGGAEGRRRREGKGGKTGVVARGVKVERRGRGRGTTKEGRGARDQLHGAVYGLRGKHGREDGRGNKEGQEEERGRRKAERNAKKVEEEGLGDEVKSFRNRLRKIERKVGGWACEGEWVKEVRSTRELGYSQRTAGWSIRPRLVAGNRVREEVVEYIHGDWKKQRHMRQWWREAR